MPAVKVNRNGNDCLAEIPVLSEDFTICWRDIETSDRVQVPYTFTEAATAAVKVALKEDELIFFGDMDKGTQGLLSEPTKTIQIQDWDAGENAFRDVASGLQYMLENHIYGSKVLAISPDLYADLQRIQEGTGRLESERIAALIDGKIYQTPVLGEKTAALLATEEQNMDLAIGQDLITGYLGSSDLNHDFRILETVLPRLKNQHAAVLYKA